MQIAEARPPYVTFEALAEEDRAATISAGHYVARDVDYAFVTPQGSRDRLQRRVDEWLDNLRQQVEQSRFPREWLRHYEESYRAWKDGREAPVSGTAVSNWPAASPAQVKAMQAVHVRTVEDLAAANEETISRLGLGARALKQRAIEWLSAASGTGKVAEEMAALRQQNAELEAANKALSKRMQELADKLDAQSAATPQRSLKA